MGRRPYPWEETCPYATMRGSGVPARLGARGRAHGRLPADRLVGECAGRGTDQRPEQVDPEVLPFAGGERRAEGSGRVHRGAGDGTAEQGVERDGAADRDRRAGADRSGVGGDADDHEHEHRGEERLVQQRGAGRDGGDGGAELGGLVGPGGQQDEGAGGGAGELRGDVGAGVAGGEVAGERERDGHCRVDVRAGEVAGGVDHGHDDQPEDEADPDGAEGPAVLGIGDDGAAAGEDECEGGEGFRGGAAPEREGAVHVGQATCERVAAFGAEAVAGLAVRDRHHMAADRHVVVAGEDGVSAGADLRV